MDKETIVSSRPDRELRKQILTPGDCNLVPYEESCCKIKLSEVTCTDGKAPCAIDPECRVFSKSFEGAILIGDNDNFIDRDFELILQQMCSGETCKAIMVYKDGDGVLKLEISCVIELVEVTEEQLVCDWSVDRLFEAATHHKESGVALFKQKRTIDAFRRFTKALKLLIATEPLDPNNVSDEVVANMLLLKIKLYSNLALCQLQFHEYDATIELCNKALKYNPDNPKALYRRCLAYAGLQMYEEAWTDIQNTLKLNPNDKAAQQRAIALRPLIQRMNKNYTSVIKKMFK